MDSHEVSFIDFLAHLVERPIFNQNVVGSSPAKIKMLPSLSHSSIFMDRSL